MPPVLPLSCLRGSPPWALWSLAWAAFVFVFFSASGSKLPSYILPMFPALALVLGWQLRVVPGRTLALLVLPLAILSSLLLLGLGIVVGGYIPEFADANNSAETFHAFAPWLVAALAIMAVSAAVSFLLLRRSRPAAKTLAIALLALGMVAGLQAGLVGYDAFRVTRSAYDLVRDVAKSADVTAGVANVAPLGGPFDPKVPVFQVRTYDQTLPFYLGRTTTLVAYRDEMALGLDAEPGLDFVNEAAWIPAWTALPQGYALMKLDDYATLVAQSVPMRVVARDPRRVFVARH